MKLNIYEDLDKVKFCSVDDGQPFSCKQRIYLKLSSNPDIDYNTLDLQNLDLIYFASDTQIDRLYSCDSEFKIYPLSRTYSLEDNSE